MDSNTHQPLAQNVPPPISSQPPQSRVWIKWVVLIIITVILASGGTYLLIQFQSQNSSKPIVQAPISPTPTPDPTADWKTYTNTDYAYQLKYPKTLNTKIPDNAPQVFIIYLTEKQDEYLEVEIGGISSLGLNKEIEFDMQRANPSKTTFQNKPAVSVRPARNIYPGEPFKAMIVYLEDKKFKIELGYYGDGKNEALFDEILSTFQFLDKNKTENVKIAGEYSFDIQIPTTYSIKKNESDNSLTKDTAHIYDDQNKEVLFIYTYAAGERTPVGNLTIDGVPFTINYFKDIQCLADLDATNWVPGTKPLFSIHIRCDKANQEQLDQYKTIIQSIKFSPALKNILIGNTQN